MSQHNYMYTLSWISNLTCLELGPYRREDLLKFVHVVGGYGVLRVVGFSTFEYFPAHEGVYRVGTTNFASAKVKNTINGKIGTFLC